MIIALAVKNEQGSSHDCIMRLAGDSPDPFQKRENMGSHESIKPPRRYTNAKCYHQISLRMSESQRLELQGKAKSARLSLNKYVLAAVKNSNVIPLEPDKVLELRKLNTWLNRVNANLNAIAKVCNVQKNDVDLALIAVALRQIDENLRVVVAGRKT